MMKRFSGLARACFAAGLLLPALTAPARADLPGTAETQDANVSVLEAAGKGLVQLEATGNGEDRVHLAIRNTSGRRLRIVFPPGLVAASVGQGFQSMGLGSPAASAGAFGQFQGRQGSSGFQSLKPGATAEKPDLVMESGQTADVAIPSVCLNFGLPTPTPADSFQLMDVDDYTPNPRARKALRSLATLGTSQKVAQAVAWNVFNGMTFGQIGSKASKLINGREIALASRFVQALDTSSGSELVAGDYLDQGRLFVRVRGGETLAADADRLARELDGQKLLGLPVRVVADQPGTEVGPACLFLDITLKPTEAGPVGGQVAVRSQSGKGGWALVGQPSLACDASADKLEGGAFAAAVEKAVAGSLVSIRTVKKTSEGAVVRVENKLPLTVAGLSLRTGRSDSTERVVLDRLGLGPARATVINVPAGSVAVDRVDLNGL